MAVNRDRRRGVDYSEPSDRLAWPSDRSGPILCGDSGMGRRLIDRGLDIHQDDSALWNRSRPEVIVACHRDDLRAGAQVLTTNTFGANTRWLTRFGQADRATVTMLNRRAVELAREATNKATPVLIAGNIGPTAVDQEGRAIREQAEVLVDAGVDLILVETLSVIQTEPALAHLRVVVESLPVVLTCYDWPAAHTDSVRRLADRGVAGLGLNCVDGPGSSFDTLKRLAEATIVPLVCQPNAGLPGQAIRPPSVWAEAVPKWMAFGVQLMGGCCGTGPEHVEAIRLAIGLGPKRDATIH